ncbi:3-phosphoshikimate 1-carboxyvinyltransferase [Ruminococcus sp.]|jgi:3-phosphoshikimate 1-carboxyvinyltransferase|uniref:3-phosphoshikimate 1-carboxyvinyltransferase n=1 Tax=Ruminococcus sp. TaxID=41978 RepID=UPI000EDE87EA|nr:3-phosphoshikimate 1-carboxyvinyltransferase [uncultured Ruminococcus sp.]HCJ97017.1 3-phosphoshikimate 1-carboxyvinyltransferase [Oscillospiraceae bacterium]
MSDVKFSPFVPNGTVNVPPSKSDVHRAIICAAMANGVSRISPVALSNDIKATIGCIKALGADAVLENNVLTVDGTNMYKNKTALLDCGESGSTLRFFIPIAAVGNINATFVGKGKLPQRPIGIFTEALPKAGTVCKTEGGLPLEIKGQLKSGIFEIPGNVSSQFITGLLLALPILEGDSEIVLTSPLESVGYTAMTIRTMKQFGVNIQATEKGWHIKGGQSYKTCDYTTDGDWSQAAFFMVLGAVSGKVTVKGVAKDSTQGDKKCAEILARFGAKVTQLDNEVTVEKGELKAITVDASQIPDLVPVLSVCAAFADGTTKIINAERLRIKECDRLKATAELLNNLGGKVKELSDGLEITGVSSLKGGNVNGYNDHRIVMSAAVCAARSDEDITATFAMSINKSYPDFYIDYNSIGGKANVLDLR